MSHNLPDDIDQSAHSEHLRRESWQIAETKRALAEADKGDFATSDEVNATLEKWTGMGT